MKIWRCLIPRKRWNNESWVIIQENNQYSPLLSLQILNLRRDLSLSNPFLKIYFVRLPPPLLLRLYSLFFFITSTTTTPCLASSLSLLCASGNPGRDDRSWCCSEVLTVLLRPWINKKLQREQKKMEDLHIIMLETKGYIIFSRVYFIHPVRCFSRASVFVLFCCF